MMENHKDQFFDAGNAESEIYEPNEEVKQEFAEAQLLTPLDESLTRKEISSSNGSPPITSAAYLRAGEEAVGGFSTTSDDDLVDEIGEAVGLTYEDDEPLHTQEKVEARDKKRWELDPASSEDYQRRVNHEGE